MPAGSHLSEGVEIQFPFAPQMTGACCVLRNVCAAEGGTLKEEEEGSSHEDNSDKDDAEAAVRNCFLRNSTHVYPAEVPACLNQHDFI